MHTVFWSNRPRLRFIEPTTPPEGTPGVVTPPLATGPDGLPVVTDPGAPAAVVTDPEGPGGAEGFPANTPTEQMTEPQRTAYWKFQSRKHERDAKAAAKKIEADAAAAADAAKTDEQRREDELRREGQVLGAQPFMKQAIRGEVRAETGLSSAEVDELLEFVDPNAFLTDGAIDDAKVKSFTGRVVKGGPAAPPAPTTPPTSVLAGLGGASAPRGGNAAPEGGSLADKKKAARERLEKNGAGRKRG